MKMCGDLCSMVWRSSTIRVHFAFLFFGLVRYNTYVPVCKCVQYLISIAIFRARGIVLQLFYGIDSI